MDERQRYLLVLLVGVVAVSGAAIFIRLAQAPPLVIGAWRLGLASLPVIALFASRPVAAGRCFTRGSLLLCLLSGISLALHFAFWIASLQHTSVMKSVVLVTTQPLFVALASPLVLRERPTAGVYLGIGVAAIGAVLMTASAESGASDSWLGYGLALLGALFAAAYFIIGRNVRGALSLGQYIGVVYPVAALVLIAASVASGANLVGYEDRTYLMFVLLALVPQLLGHSSLNWSLRYLPATTVTIAVLGEPIGAAILAALLLGELPSLPETAGAGIVLVGVWLALRAESTSAVPSRHGAIAQQSENP